MDLSNYSPKELIGLQVNLYAALLKKGIVRTKNIKGDVGEYLTIEYFNSNNNLPNLTPSKIGQEDIDAMDDAQKLYSIKTITTKSTGCFYNLELPNSDVLNSKKFDFLIITELNDDWSLKRILRLSWELFLKYKSWHSTMTCWKITLKKLIVAEADVIFDQTKN